MGFSNLMWPLPSPRPTLAQAEALQPRAPPHTLLREKGNLCSNYQGRVTHLWAGLCLHF